MTVADDHEARMAKIFTVGRRTGFANMESLPEAVAVGGYLYILRYNTGAVKVGRTRDARRRVIQHHMNARAGFYEITAGWVSSPHVSTLENGEKILVDWCARNAVERRGRETFRGIDFDLLVEWAKDMPRDAKRPIPVSITHLEMGSQYRLEVVCSVLGIGNWGDPLVRAYVRSLVADRTFYPERPANFSVDRVERVAGRDVLRYVIDCDGVVPTANNGFNILPVPWDNGARYVFSGSNKNEGFPA